LLKIDRLNADRKTDGLDGDLSNGLIDNEFKCEFSCNSMLEPQPLIQFSDIRTDIPTANWDDKVEQLPLELTVVGKLEGFCFGKNSLKLLAKRDVTQRHLSRGRNYAEITRW
jgi:hypothetical protein